MSSAFTEHFFQSTDGLQLYYREFGARGARSFSIVCLPGLTRNSRDFEGLAQALAQRHHVLTPDLRGRGRSAYDPTFTNYAPTQYVQDTFRLLEVAGVRRCAVVGTSLGGLIGMAMGAVQPQRIAGVVINDIGPVLDPAGVARIRTHAGKLPAVQSWEEAAAQARFVHSTALPDLDDEAWLDFARRTYREENGAFRRDVDPNIARALDGASAQAPDLWPVFRQLRMPLLTIRGALSDLFSMETLGQMQAIRPDMQVVVVPNRGHAPTLDEPEVRATLLRFLGELPD